MSADQERHSLVNQEGSRAERNEEAFQNIVEKTGSHVANGFNVVIDSGLTEKRVSILDKLAQERGVSIYKFYLEAPYDVLFERVKLRDANQGRETDEARFKEVFQIIASKDFGGYEIIKTDNVALENIVEKIITSLAQSSNSSHRRL